MIGHKVVFAKSHFANLVEYPVREPKDNEVVVKVYYSLISAGTEKAFLSAQPNTGATFPAVPGYSSVGEIINLGATVKNFSIGDRVFVAYGGHSSYNVKDVSHVYKIPDIVPFTDAVFTKIASFPLLALRRARLELGESVVIVGLGMLGLLGVQLAKISGALPVIAVGNREIRREKAAICGADFVYDPLDKSLVNNVIEKTKITSTIGGADIIIDTTGNIDALLSALKYVAKKGRIVISGCNRVTDKPIDIYKYITLKGVELIGAHNFARPSHNSMPGNWTNTKDFKVLLGLMADGRLKPSLINPTLMSPKSTTDIYNALLNDKEFPLGAILDWNEFHV